jgi:hypothetical protein
MGINMNEPSNGAKLVEVGKAHLRMLAPSDFVALKNKIREGYLADARAVITETQMSPERGAVLLLEAKRRDIQRSDVVDFALSVDGWAEVIGLAMKRTDDGKVATMEQIDALEIDMSQINRIMSELCGFRLAAVPQAGAPNPPPGAPQTEIGTLTRT